MAETVYLISKYQDRLWITGSAVLSLCLVIPLLAWPAFIPFAFWAWAFFFDGPHIWATYSRTYLDIQSWGQHSRLYLGSLLFIILPLIFLWLDNLYPDASMLYLFLTFAMLWAYHHIVRQHYGFLSLYDRKAGNTQLIHLSNKWCLYLGLWLPYLHLGLNHPVNINMFSLHAFHSNTALHTLANWLPPLLSGLILLLCFYRYCKRQAKDQAALFLLVCLTAQSLILYLLSRFEPLLPGASSATQYFMVVTLLITLIHNIQYLAFVWRYNKKNYAANQAMPNKPTLLVKRMNKNWLTFYFSGLLFALIYVYLEWAMAEYPWLDGKHMAAGGSGALYALALWWGFSLHHFYLDQKIWRPSRSGALYQKMNNLT